VVLYGFCFWILIISLEIVWFRVLGTLMRSDAYAFSLILGIFLLGDGLGVVSGAEVAPRLMYPLRAFQLLQGVMGLYALVSLAAAFALDAYTGFSLFTVETPRHYAGALTFAVVLPPAFLLGMSFPITQRAIQDDLAMVGRRVGLVQLCNILGNTTGAVLTGLVLLHWLGTVSTLRLIGVGSLAFVLMAFVEGRRRAEGVIIVALAALLAIFPNNVTFWSAIHGTTTEDAIVSEDRTGIAVLRLAGSRAQSPELREDGSPELTPHDTLFIAGHAQSRVPFLLEHGVLGSLGAMLHPNPQDIFVIGQGTGGTPIAAGANAKTLSIRVVDIVAPVFNVMEQAALRSGEDVMHKPLRDYYADPRYTRIVADARHVLLSEENRYDIIEADALYPRTALAGQLYSTDFFRLALHRLRPGGYVVQWVPTDRTRTSFLRVFPYAVDFKWVMIGSASPINVSYEQMNKELAGPLGEYLASMGWNRNDIRSALISGLPRTWTPDVPREDRDVNTDIFPKDEYYRNGRKIDLIGEG
jgi:spermidine synthase